MAFNNAQCPCGTSQVYSFNTEDGIENKRCSRCLSMDGHFDEPAPPPSPSIHDRIQKALGALVVEGGLTDSEKMYLAEVAEAVNTHSIREALLAVAKAVNTPSIPNFEGVNF